MSERPKDWTWSGMGWGRPESIPRDVPDAKPPETLLVGPDGKTPILVKQPRTIGFRPERAR